MRGSGVQIPPAAPAKTLKIQLLAFLPTPRIHGTLTENGTGNGTELCERRGWCYRGPRVAARTRSGLTLYQNGHWPRPVKDTEHRWARTWRPQEPRQAPRRQQLDTDGLRDLA